MCDHAFEIFPIALLVGTALGRERRNSEATVEGRSVYANASFQSQTKVRPSIPSHSSIVEVILRVGCDSRIPLICESMGWALAVDLHAPNQIDVWHCSLAQQLSSAAPTQSHAFV